MKTKGKKIVPHIVFLIFIIPVSAHQAVGEVLPLWKIPFESLTEMQTRPLFTENRQGLSKEEPPPPSPPPQEQPQVIAPPETLQATLIGVLRSANEFGLAVLKEVSGEKIKHIKVGETFEGWKLSTVNPGEAIFERNGQLVTLKLQKYQFKGASPQTLLENPNAVPSESPTTDATSTPMPPPEPQQSDTSQPAE